VIRAGEERPMESERGHKFKFYVGLWIVMICIAAIEVFFTYQHLPERPFVAFLLALAFLEGGLAIMYFMQMKYESPNLFWTLIPITLFALFMLDHIWPDAFRLARLSMIR
jgi:cytochrome c oxidase subunit IV